MNIAELISLFEAFAPARYQESYDNSGLQVGNREDEITGALLTLDITEEIIGEAIARGCNLIIAHHPVIFNGIKSLTGNNYVQRIVEKAIRNNINLYAVHTNLDNMLAGVNDRIARKLGLQNTRILAPASGNLLKLVTYAPAAQAGLVLEALFAAGAGKIGQYSECSFTTPGTGTFRGSDQSKPFIGTPGGDREQADETKIEVIVPVHLRPVVQKNLLAAHPYEEVAFDWLELRNENPVIGAGLIGQLAEPVSEENFLNLLKINMNAKIIRHTALSGRPVSRVAVCGGSGSFLLKDALTQKADVFVSADFKYHQFFDAEGRILIADPGHFETEQFTVEIFDDILRKKMLPSPFFFPHWIPTQ